MRAPIGVEMELDPKSKDRSNQHGASAAQVALAWVLKHPAVTAPIIGASKLTHVSDAVSALGVTLSAEEIARLEEPYRPKAVLDHS